ncbi:hypothetical protein [Nocardioides insulae]|uniref:hypothetical protein n=1 Tax=Nocardioides insulae TaxID=394734 RepID=UPI00048D3738|nr:hypothetical protein [Nocardioides insulae]
MSALLLTLAVATGGCTARADSETVSRTSASDPSGDVIVAGPHLGDGQPVAAPQDTHTDIVHTIVEHRADTVAFEVRFRGLRPNRYLDLTADIRTDKTGSRAWQFSALTYNGEVQVDLYGPHGSKCPAASTEYDYPANTVRMSVPRGCLGDPAWIQTTVTAASMTYEASSPARHAEAVWEDDAGQDGLTTPAEKRTGPRLHHP